MRLTEKAVGAFAVVMALCCAAIPIAGGALAGGLAFGGGIAGVVLGAIVLVALGAFLLHRRRRRACSPTRGPA